MKVLNDIRNKEYKSSYADTYGRKPALTDLSDIAILKNQKFSQIPCAYILNIEIKEILGKGKI